MGERDDERRVGAVDRGRATLGAAPRRVVGSVWCAARLNDVVVIAVSLVFMAIGWDLVVGQMLAMALGARVQGAGLPIGWARNGGVPGGYMLVGMMVFAGMWTAGFAVLVYQLRRRAAGMRRLCAEGRAVYGEVLSKRVWRNPNARSLATSRCYLVVYGFVHPYTGKAVRLEARLSRKKWDRVAEGMPVNVLVDAPPGNGVIVYEFVRFRVEPAPAEFVTRLSVGSARRRS